MCWWWLGLSAVPEIPGIHADAVMTGRCKAESEGKSQEKHVVVLGAGLIG